jgi:hypothetical protein
MLFTLLERGFSKVLKEDYIHFVNGSKPAYICVNDCPEFEKLISSYPSAPVIKGKTTIFFHSAQERDEFSEKMMGIEIPSADYFRHLGLALGYPPVAVDFFVQYIYDRDRLEKYAAAFSYAGRYFGGHIDDAETIAQWLWDNVSIPTTEVMVDHHGNRFSIYPPKQDVV